MGTNYQRPLGHYAREYGISLATVKRYSRKGYHLDEPLILAKEVDRQKNRPPKYAGRYSTQSATPTTPPGKRDIPPAVFAALVSGQRAVLRFNRWARKLKAAAPTVPREDFALLAGFVTAMMRRELQAGIFDMARAASGAPLSVITATRREQEAAFHDETRE